MFLSPFHVDFDITLACTHKCLHCNVSAGKRLDDELSFEEICSIIDEFEQIGVCHISFTGGEPLLRSDCVNILEYAASKNSFKLVLNTNGLLLTREFIKRISKFKDDILIAISMDGYDCKTYSNLRKTDELGTPTSESQFNRIIENIQMLIAENIRVTINYTITKLTIGNFYETFEKMNSIGIKGMLGIKFFPFGQGDRYKDILELDYNVWKDFLIELIRKKMSDDKYKGIKISVPSPWELYLPLLEYGYSKEVISKIFQYNSPLETKVYRRNRDIGCHAGVTSCAISPNGDVYPCGTVSSNYPDFIAGNLRKTTMADIWKNSTKLKDFRSIELSLIEGNCGECKISYLCGGGCRARAYFKTKSLLSADYLCPKNQTKGGSYENIDN